MEATRQEFCQFCVARTIGRYNMFTEGAQAAKSVKLDLDTYQEILFNFKKYNNKYPDIVPKVEKNYMKLMFQRRNGHK